MANVRPRADRWSSSESTVFHVAQPTRTSRHTPTTELSAGLSMADETQEDTTLTSKIDDNHHLHPPVNISPTTESPGRRSVSPISSAAMTQQVLRLAEKINDQYLTCKICLEPFKDPKCLTCLHTFCEQCIENHVSAQRSYKYTDYREFACPICRKKTAIPTGGVHKLPDNFLIAGLSEMIAQKNTGANGAAGGGSTVKVSTNCDICKAVHDREREASSRCLECQKFLCRHCVQAHQTITVTRDHSIYELEIEKDILCKHHLTEFVRFYCEQCEACVCIACTYSDHRDHDLTDFRSASTHHKAYIIECLENCKSRMTELEAYLDVIRRCDSNIAQIEASIHALASTFEKSLRVKEQELVAQISTLYGDESGEFIKRREELDEYFEQIKNTCSLTELVVNGKDIELLLVKKQLVDKFRELESVELDPLPDNICMRVKFIPGQLNLGTLEVCEVTPIDDDEREGVVDEDEGQDDVEDENEDEKKSKSEVDLSNTNSEQSSKYLVSISTQTDDITPETATQAVQTIDDTPSTGNFIFENGSLSTSSLPIDENGSMSPSSSSAPASIVPTDVTSSNTNAYEQSNKLSRRVRRLLKPTCSVAVLPNTDVIILDCEQNLVSILDKRGKFKYCFTSEIASGDRKGFAVAGFSSTANVSNAPAGSNRTVRIPTQQGLLCIKLKGERVSDLPLGFTVHAFNSISESEN